MKQLSIAESIARLEDVPGPYCASTRPCRRDADKVAVAWNGFSAERRHVVQIAGIEIFRVAGERSSRSELARGARDGRRRGRSDAPRGVGRPVVDSLALHRWLRMRLCAGSLSLANSKSPESGDGPTKHIFDASWTRAGSIHTRAFVLQLAPVGPAMRLISGRCIACAICNRHRLVLLPAVLAADLEGRARPTVLSWISSTVGCRPTGRRSKRASSPTSPDAQRRFHDSCIDAIASIHATPIDDALVAQHGPNSAALPP